MSLLVLDLEAIDPAWRRDLETLPSLYCGELNGEVLRHLAWHADQRERQREEKFAKILLASQDPR